MTDLAAPLAFARGPAMRNRLMLAPLTNQQSRPDGTLSEEEYRWLTMRAEGGFGAVMTCAAHVQRVGQGFPGQLGCWSDDHIPGLSRLAAKIKAEGSVSLVQLHHAGIRAPAALIGEAPVGPSADEKTGARALTTAEVEVLRDDFIAAAVRSQRAGFDGVELHGAHSYVLCGFLSVGANHRTDAYGGTPENRARLLYEIIAGIRGACRPDFILGVRLSPERFGLDAAEMIALAASLLADPRIDFLDMSLWDCFKTPEDSRFAEKPLIDWFASLPRGLAKLGVAGQLRSAADAARALAAGCDFALIGRAAILHHDWPKRAIADPAFTPIETPVRPEHLEAEGVSPGFVDYLDKNFRMVARPAA